MSDTTKHQVKGQGIYSYKTTDFGQARSVYCGIIQKSFQKRNMELRLIM